jgi:TRAP transporter TAXI family solute receptor
MVGASETACFGSANETEFELTCPDKRARERLTKDMSRFGRGFAAATVVFACTALGCTKPVDANRSVATVRVSSSGSAAQSLSALSQVTDVSVQSVRVSGSPAVIDALREGELDVGVATADVAYLAFAGQLDEAVPAFDQLRGMAVLGLNTLHLIVAKHRPAESVADLRGFNIALGTNSGTALLANLLLNASGLSLSDVRRNPLPLPYADAAIRLANGELDAAFMTIVPPGDPAVVATRAGARVLEIEGPAVERLRLQHPFLVNTIIPRGSYPGQTRPIRTIGVDLLLLCRADLADDLVYRLVEAYFAGLDRSIPAIDFDRAPATSIPLHPGAARYYRQRQLSR